MKLLAFFLALLPLFRSAPQAQGKPAPAGPAAQATQTLAAERRELAEIRLLVGAERKFAEAKERLGRLKASVAASSESGAKDLLDQVTAFELEVRRTLGEAVAGPVSPDGVDQAVAIALRNQEFDFVRGLGKFAVPALQDYVRQHPENFTGLVAEDPLSLLFEIDPLAASQVMGELLEVDDFFWKKRALRLIGPNLASMDALWTAGAPERWLGEGFSRMAEKHVEDPDLGLGALHFLVVLAVRGERASTLDAVLGRALRSSDPSRRNQAKSLARQYPALLGAGAFEALLGESEADLRLFGSEMLVRAFPASRALLSRGSDEEAGVRENLAAWLDGTAKASWGEEERAALARLLTDPEAAVRRRALTVLGRLPAERTEFPVPDGFPDHVPPKWERWVFTRPLPAEVYRSLLPSGHGPGVFNIAAALPAPLCFELAEALARSADPQVLKEVVPGLYRLPYWEDPRALLRVAEALLENPSGASERDDVCAQLQVLLKSRGTLDALARWLLARPEDDTLRQLRRGAGFQSKHVVLLEPRLGVPVMARLFGVDRDEVRAFFRPGEVARAWTVEHSLASRALAADAAQPLGLRVLALHGVLNDGSTDEDFLALASAVLADPAWRADPEWERDELEHLLQRDLGATGNALLLQVLRAPELPESLARELSPRLRADQPGAAEIVALVLERGFDSERWNEPIRFVFEAMANVPALQDPEALARGAHHPRHERWALTTIGRLRDPRYLPLLSELVAAPRDAFQLRWTAEALFGYLDAEAAEPLLAAASKVEDPDVRDRCLAHLEKIREYQDAKERWATRKVRAQTREQVIADLVAQLDAQSDEVKVQAIRALATWEAVEVMPRLIELTTSGSKSVAAAAREALERLNAREKD